MGRPLLQDKSVQLHFVDDRAETLLHMAQQPHLQRWNLYFADWCACSSHLRVHCASFDSPIRRVTVVAINLTNGERV